MKKNLFKFIGLGLLLIVLVYHGVWFANRCLIYYPLTENIPKHVSGVYAYYDPESKYNYNVKFPNYLSFTGNLAISSNNGEGLIIWPGFFGKDYTYGLMLEYKGKIHQIYVDNMMNPIDTDPDKKEILDANKDTAQALKQGAQIIWPDAFTPEKR